MNAASVARRILLLLAITAVVAGCASPQESGPEDLNKDKDRDGLPDDWARNASNATANGSAPVADDVPGI